MKITTSSVVTLSLLAGLVAATPTVFAQATADTFPLPSSLPEGTKISIGGSQSLEALNKGLQERFQKKFPTAAVTPTYNSSKEGIAAVEQGKSDIAGVGRLLTKAEQDKGLGAKSLGYEKIAIIVSDQNPFANGNITLDQFAKIYRGEITDWSKIKGPAGKIRVVDRPDGSDTRQAFARYPVFKSGVKTGSNVAKLTEDSAQAVAAKLGKDGVGYVPVSQLKGLTGVKALSLHNTQPDNPKYPFSQPMAYVYNKAKASDGTKAMLSFIDTPEAAAAITAAGFTPAVASGASAGNAPASSAGAAGNNAGTGNTGAAGTNIAASPIATSGTGSDAGWPWWLLPLGLLGAGAGGWLLLGGKKDEPEANEPKRLKPLYPDTATGGAGTAMVPENDRGIPLSGDLSIPTGNLGNMATSTVDAVKDRSGDMLKGAAAVGGAAVAGGAALVGLGQDYNNEDQSATLSSELSGELPRIDVGNPLDGLKEKASGLMPEVNLPDVNLGNPVAGLQAKVGEVGEAIGSKLPEVGNPVPGVVEGGSDLLKGLGVAGAGVVAGGAAIAGGLLGKGDQSADAATAKANPDAPGEGGGFLSGLTDKAADLLQGGKDAASGAIAGGTAAVGGTVAAAKDGARSLFSGSDDDQSGELSLESPDFETPISALYSPDKAGDGGSAAAAVAPEASEAKAFNPLDVLGEIKSRATDQVQDLASNSGAALAGGVAATTGLAAGAGAAVKSFFNAEDQTPADGGGAPEWAGEGQITLVSPNPSQAYVHWDVPVKLKRQLRQQGGKKLAVRMYDVTDWDSSQGLPANFQEVECDELAWDLHLPVPTADRRYLVEIGYVTEDRQWLMLARSTPVLIASAVQ